MDSFHEDIQSISFVLLPLERLFTSGMTNTFIFFSLYKIAEFMKAVVIKKITFEESNEPYPLWSE